MGHRIYWIEEPHILGVDYTGIGTSEDLEAVLDYCLPQCDAHPICFLVNLNESSGFEPSILKSLKMKQVLTHPNTKWWAIVGVHGMYKFAFQFFMRFVAVKAFDQQEEAVSFLKERMQEILQGDNVNV